MDENQPASPSATLQSLVSRLRRTLGAASEGETGSEILRSREPGWLLDVAPAAVDALRFQELTARARLRSGRGEAAAAAEDLAAAIGLWRGAAFVDVVEAGYLATHATRLNEARRDAVEDLAEAELAMGRPADALARLEEHVDANPLRERAWGLLMTALYRLGRQAAALGTFQEVRALLSEELGLEPSLELVEIEQRILRHDRTLAGPRATPLSTTAPPSPEAPRPPAGEFADYSVVVVEDHDFQRRTVVQLLRGLGVGTVKDAADGAEALGVLQGMPVPDVVICDIDMPAMDGVEFVTRVAEGNLACSVVIASGLESNVLRAVEAIGEGHGLQVLAALPKPLTARRLGEVLRQYTRLNGGRTDSPSGAPLSREDVQEALEGGGFCASFDPRIDLTTGAFSSAEAGARWHAADGTPIPSSLVAPAMAGDDLLLAVVERLVAASTLLLDEVRSSGILAMIVLVAVTTMIRASRILLRPLGELAAATQEVAGGNYRKRVRIQGVSELEVLASTFNSMASAIESDVSRRERAEREAVQARAAAEEANQAKSTFVAAMSHEIRTPMIGVTGMLEVLAHTDLSPEQENMVATASGSAQVLLQIIGDILDFSKIEAGRLELAPAAFMLRPLAESAVQSSSTPRRPRAYG